MINVSVFYLEMIKISKEISSLAKTLKGISYQRDSGNYLSRHIIKLNYCWEVHLRTS